MKIDLRSDTVTVPTKGMLAAMLAAPVGDDVFGEDPTVRKLEEKVAQLFGKEAAIFCPSGTMSNQIGIRLHTQPGDEVICHRESHVYKYEGGGIAVNSGCSIRTLEGNRGRIDAESVLRSINSPNDIHCPTTRLVCVEDTTNRGGGACYDFVELEKIKEICVQFNLAFHLDGARVFNALLENGLSPPIYATPFDTISICLSKGLGAPVGSVLLGNAAHIKKARRLRKLFGGGMRQAGYLAAAGIYALDHHVERLSEDHRRARILASCLKECSWVKEVYPAQTNIVVFACADDKNEKDVVAKLAQHDIRAMPFGKGLIRMVTHLNIDDEMIEYTQRVLGGLADKI